MSMTRRDLLAAAPAAAIAATWPQHTQRLPLMRLPAPMPPSGLGVGAPWQSGDNIPAMLERLRPAWWYDWRFEQTGAPGYVPMIWSDGVWDMHQATLVSLFERRPDQFWLIWNEPERADQANMAPERAAALTTEIAAHGIGYAAPGVALTSDGYIWLEDYLRHGGPVPHCWHVHIYRCIKPDQWLAAWGRWRNWMHDHDVVRPTIVSETNGWTEGSYGQRRMLEQVDAVLEFDELLQAAAWFATRWDSWGSGVPDLLDDDGELTPTGATFAHLREQS